MAVYLISRLPERVSLQAVAREIAFVAGVREGFKSHEREGGSKVIVVS
jgi:hypothetical protein